jgi:hypothetical protein
MMPMKQSLIREVTIHQKAVKDAQINSYKSQNISRNWYYGHETGHHNKTHY